ncbi:MAG: hypothetical protein U0746_16010 [Gemmataceae bacterium]
MTRSRRIADTCLVAGFLAAVGGVAAWSAVRMASDEAAFPGITRLKQFPAVFEAFFGEHLGGRGAFLMANAAIKVDGFGVSPTPRVAVGAGGWMYYETTKEADALKSAQVDDDKLLAMWSGGAILWHDWLAARGARLLVVPCPDKQTIYPEHQPAARGHRRGTTQLDRTMAVWAREPRIQVVDLRTDLRAAKGQGEIYYRTDTHWNPAGALVGYRSIARALGQDPRSADDYRWEPLATNDTDLPRMMSKSWGIEERFLFPHPRFPTPAHRSSETVALTESRWLRHLTPEVWEQEDASKPRVVLIHDSFAVEPLRMNLAQHCRRLVCVPSYTPDEMVIDRERPDVVVWMYVERVLRSGLPGLPPPPSSPGSGETHAAAR